MGKAWDHGVPGAETWLAVRGLLPLAKGILREWGCCLRAESPAEPFRRAGADCLPGKEDPDEGRGSGRADGGARRAKKRYWGTLTGTWVPHDTRDQIVDFVRRWSEKTEIGAGRLIGWLDITVSKFYDWRGRYGKVNEHNGWVPRDFWLEDWEEAGHHWLSSEEPVGGLPPADIHDARRRRRGGESDQRMARVGARGTVVAVERQAVEEGHGFEQPLAVHQHWHIDVSYINISGTFYYLCSILDGCSRYIVNWDLRESMTEADIEVILERAKELHMEAKPRIISGNGRQFIAKDFKEFIRVSGMTHVRTSPYYPQSNGKIERWHKSLKGECIRPGTPLAGRCEGCGVCRSVVRW